ncbi:MAG: hypothetical protein ACK58T_15105 [Phycisphaerae bacterium]
MKCIERKGPLKRTKIRRQAWEQSWEAWWLPPLSCLNRFRRVMSGPGQGASRHDQAGHERVPHSGTAALGAQDEASIPRRPGRRREARIAANQGPAGGSACAAD